MSLRRFKSSRRLETPAGPKVHRVSVITVGVLVLFVAIILALIAADVWYTDAAAVGRMFRSPEVLAAMGLSGVSSIISLALVLVFSIPAGYALSRYRFPGHSIADTIVDLPIVLPPVVIGISLLVFFATAPGRWVERAGFNPHSLAGIVACQFLVSVSYAIRAAKSAFDAVDRRLEQLALTLGCTHGQAFRKVALPLAGSGIVAGGIMAWARAVGVFGPIMVFVGSVRRKTEVMPTTIYLELTIGRIEMALAVAMVMVAMAAAALVLIHRTAAGRRWWGA